MEKDYTLEFRNVGVNFNAGNADIYVWAPLAKQVNISILQGPKLALEPSQRGVWKLTTSELPPGAEYLFELVLEDETMLLPDPCSLYQPGGVHAPSRAVDLRSFSFTDTSWKGLALDEFIIYELHIGTFTAQGSFEAAIEKIDHLVDLGVTAVEIMPVAAFPGKRNWGYDGVFAFAVQESYGGPEGLMRFVDACHAKGLAVILDVVYNHFGPEGNYLPHYGPYFTDKYSTPWGQAVNFDDAGADEVRRFVIENMLMWFRDFHIDALRLDAVHAIKDMGATHILAEMRAVLDHYNLSRGMNHRLIVECDLNAPRYINSLQKGGYGMSAQWIDEFHHALRVAAGQPQQGYYADFNGVEDLAKSYADAYVYDGRYSEERQRSFGARADNAACRFVVFSQNHDQVGNRMLGERSGTLYSPSMMRLLAAAVLVSPYLPLLFMGEEWGESRPFLYFVDHSEPSLIEAVRKGRAEEFKAFQQQQDPPDPQSSESFLRSKISWPELAFAGSAKHMFDFYKDMIKLRKTQPVLRNGDRFNLRADAYPAQHCLLLYRWNAQEKLVAVMNFSSERQSLALPGITIIHKLIDSEQGSYAGNEGQHASVVAEGTVLIAPESFSLFSYV